MLKAEVFSGAANLYTGMSAGTIVPSLDTATLDVLTPFTPTSSVANYTLKRKLILGYLPNGQILTGSLTDGNFGYSSATGVAVLSGTGTGASVDITASANGAVASGALTNVGTSYLTSSSVPTSGVNGSGLTLDITAEIIGAAEIIDTLTLGSNYTDSIGAPTLAITGSGAGLTVGFSTSNGSIDSLFIVSPGSGYEINDTIQILAGDSLATFVVDSVSLGQILTATISLPGSGYIVGDVVTISGGNATFTIDSISGGTITSVSINNPGTGYAAGDVLTISGGSATYTVGTVTNNTEITDELPSNNTISDLNFAVTNYTYARDNNAFSGSTSNGTDGFEVGNLFDIWNDQTLNGLTIRLAGGTNGTTIGTEIIVRIYSIDPNTGDFVFLEESAPTIVAANNTNTLWTIPFLSPVNLNANTTYLAVVGSFDATLRVSNAGSSEPQTSFFFWYTL
jgi:hypothetical protein